MEEIMITYEPLKDAEIGKIAHLCNALMAYQKSVAHIAPERFDTMRFETRLSDLRLAPLTLECATS